MDRDINNGRWASLQSLEHFNKILTEDDWCVIKKGEWSGPGWYWIFTYSQRCPRGCCYDSVIEAITAKELADELRESMIYLAQRLRDARALSATTDTGDF